VRRLAAGLAIAAAALLAGGATSSVASYDMLHDGVLVRPVSGSEQSVRLQVYADRIVRVVASPEAGVEPARSLMVTAVPRRTGFTVTRDSRAVLLSTSKLRVSVNLADGNVTFRDPSGATLLAESAPATFVPTLVEGKRFFATRQQWNRGTDEGLYGLGQHQNRQMNYLGEDVELAQHNMDVAIPFLVSTRNYGILWDNNSITRFGNPAPYAFVGERLKVTGDDGRPGFTARYHVGGRLAVTRQEPVINYQYIRDQARWPAEARPPATATGEAAAQRVTWTGTIHPRATGVHKFQLYSSSYVKLFVDGKPVLERWRQNWNPWFHNFDLPLEGGRPAEFRIEWEPNAGYIALFHSDPLPPADRNSISFASELGQALDYYFVGGDSMDEVIAGYRALTGKAVLLPKWAYGFWQSRQRYSTQQELLDVVRQYRARGLPLDNIVQDWFYWPEDQWGSHRFEKSRFPDPKGMIDGVHAMGARFMISVWPKFYPNTDNYTELAAKGLVYRGNIEAGRKDWVGPGYLNTDYDPYSEEGRRIYWRQIRDRLAVLGVDAWWLDATEPDIHSNLSIDERKAAMTPTALGPGAAFFNSFPLVHAEGVYDGLRVFAPRTRSFILTRSAFGGLQRTGSAVWSGDVAARWDDLRDQIAAGVNFSMSGIPNWTHDIGGFAVEDRYTRQDPAHLDEWRELNTRWFQFGAFSPLFRSHGEFPHREIYALAPAGSPAYRSMEYYDRLRYRLMPYIYTIAADTYWRDGTIMRGLVMDFPDDRPAREIDDQYLFGPGFLVAPVSSYRARSRSIYLPAGATWYDFYDGRSFRGGASINASAPYERMPLFVRAGSIIPIGPPIQTTAEDPGGPLTLFVYTGTDGSFSLYEDDGVSLGYRDRAWSRIPIRWHEKTGTLTIGKREGGYPGMIAMREIRIRWMRPDQPRPLDLDAPGDATIRYAGRATTVRFRPRRAPPREPG
jgi:alpha-D-xyloside xylohydrolase